MTDIVEPGLEGGKEKHPTVPAETAKDLRSIERVPGKYALWEVSPSHQYNVGTNFPWISHWEETRNFERTGSLEHFVGGSAHLYLLSQEEAGRPAICFVSDRQIANTAEIKENLMQTIQDDHAVPFIQDKKTGLLIVPISYTTKQSMKETMHVGPLSGTHRDLQIFPLLTRELLGEASKLTTDDYPEYGGQLKYGDMLQTGEGAVFSTFLTKDLSPEASQLLAQLDIFTHDTLPASEKEPAMRQWYDMLKGVYGLREPAALLPEYLHYVTLNLSRYNDFADLNDSKMTAFTPGLFDAESLNEQGERMELTDPSKREIMEAIVDGYNPETGLESKAMVLYVHPTTPFNYLLVIGGSHPEVQMYMKKLVRDYRNYNYRFDATVEEPIEIAQLAGTVFFDNPEEFRKSDFESVAIPTDLSMRVALDKLQPTPQYTVDKQRVLRALEQLQVSTKSRLRLTIADSLREQMKPELKKPIV